MAGVVNGISKTLSVKETTTSAFCGLIKGLIMNKHQYAALSIGRVPVSLSHPNDNCLPSTPHSNDGTVDEPSTVATSIKNPFPTFPVNGDFIPPERLMVSP
jgi:hypothetical protein